MSTQVTVAFHWLFPLSLTSFASENVPHLLFSYSIKFCPKKSLKQYKDKILIDVLFLMGFAEEEMNVTSKNNFKIIGFVCKCTKTWKECKYVPFKKKCSFSGALTSMNFNFVWEMVKTWAPTVHLLELNGKFSFTWVCLTLVLLETDVAPL